MTLNDTLSAVVICMLWPIILMMVVLTHWVKRPGILWTFILFPPLSLLSLWWIPLAQWLAWGPVLVAAVVSFIGVLLRIGVILQEWRQSTRDTNRLRLIKLVRPALVILVVGTLLARERLAINQIRAYGEELARQIQQACDRDGKCPEMIDGWEVIGEHPTAYESVQVVSRMGRKARVCYLNLQNEFELVVNYYNLFWFPFHGGVGRDLSGPFRDMQGHQPARQVDEAAADAATLGAN